MKRVSVLQNKKKQLLAGPILLFAVLNVLFNASCMAEGQNGGTKENKAVATCVVIVHVDVMPPYAEPALKLLQEYRHDSKADAGEKRVELLQQVGRPNHFTVIEEWSDQNAYEQHLSAKHTRDFRTTLQPMLGSPFDERLHNPAS